MLPVVSMTKIRSRLVRWVITGRSHGKGVGGSEGHGTAIADRGAEMTIRASREMSRRDFLMVRALLVWCAIFTAIAVPRAGSRDRELPLPACTRGSIGDRVLHEGQR